MVRLIKQAPCYLGRLLLALSFVVPLVQGSENSESALIGSIGERLRNSDEQLNNVYSTLKDLSESTQHAALRKDQRDWLKRRNTYCQLDSALMQRSDWQKQLASDYGKALCVIEFTDERIKVLSDRIPAVSVSVPAKPKLKTWGDRLNPGGEAPLDSFKAFYFESTKPDRPAQEAEVGKIALNFPYDKGFGIPSETFAAYWVGRVAFDRDTAQTLELSLSWAKVRLIINKAVVYEGGSDQSIPFTFTAGEHLIEIEYINNWHTTEFSFTRQALVQKHDIKDIGRVLKGLNAGDASILYAALYESKSADLTTTVSVINHQKPVVLLLSSYGPVSWHIVNPGKADIRAVIFGSHAKGSTVTGDLDGDVPLLALKTRVGNYRIVPSCSCMNGRFHCEGRSGLDDLAGIERDTGLTVFGGTFGTYSASFLTLPTMLFDTETRQELQRRLDTVEAQRKACTKPGFDDVFGEG
ncbi:lysozyme inhibitor LprI family protein [Parendozoicomonas haliclonae]|uniref:Lysozyme inhibitor LprI-like N-terminal domain-containing protein n=1 Tax=Parendozoicomonas haliclonae TaxID=1960125 RepID=A0A1X7AIE8_9GAMM|nr:lysozyme inhibitor LprI family protein [Parendozoicomonas haliclonae]SMA43080.1 hypothetical protein EHSB41UT_01551 [Parendozoicomonas haliclonae]